jgi:DNA-binding transcriptional MocR family regulator
MLSIEREFIRTERPLYGHLVSLLEAAIARGELPSGTRVPPERTLAQRLKISRTTVVSAYRELESRGLLRGYVDAARSSARAPEPEGTPFAWRGKIAAGGAAHERHHAARPRAQFVRFTAALARRGRTGAGQVPERGAFIEAVDHVLTNRRAVAVGLRGPDRRDSRRCASAIADRYGVPRDSVLILSGAQQGLDPARALPRSIRAMR